jgi:hypothetical protein
MGGMRMMELKDIVLFPIYLALVYIVATYLEPKLTNKTTKPYYFKAIHFKMFGTVFFTFIYQFYYRMQGDTASYFFHAYVMTNVLFSDPIAFVKMLWSSGGEFYMYGMNGSLLWFQYSKEEWFVSRIAAFIGIFSLNSYIGTAFIMSFITFIGIWKMYQSFVGIYPNLAKPFAISCFFIPSTVFWSGGILKDCVTYAAVGYFVYAFFNITYYKRKIYLSLFILLICAHVLQSVKLYILITLIPALAVWYYSSVKSSIKNPIIKALSLPFIILMSAAGGYYFTTKLAASDEKYSSSEALEKRVRGFHSDHLLRVNTSSYSLGDLDFSTIGIIKKIPAAINVTLFRPYLWEVRNAVTLISAIESFIFFAITAYIILKGGFFKVLRVIFGNPEMQLCLLYTILLGFAVGFTAYNFGALVRFKIPLLPFFGMGLSLLWDKRPIKRD